ncbi:MAG: hypothetical protein ABUK01_12270 [Leptospirales bacterium]
MNEPLKNLTVGSVSAQTLSVTHGVTFDAGLTVKGAATVKGTITIGDTEITEANLIGLLKLLNK